MLLLSVSLSALFLLRAHAINVRRPSKLTPRAAALPSDLGLGVSDHVLTLQRSPNRLESSLALAKHITANSTTNSTANSTITLQSEAYGASYAVTVTLEGTDMLLLLDTGSSDTWIVKEDFTCIDPYGRTYPQEDCEFGALYNGSFPDGAIPDTNFNISYGSGEFVTGEVGLMNISVAGVSFTQQEIALVDQAYWFGDDETSGIVGFAYEALTSSYSGDDPEDDDSDTNLILYSPVVKTALTRNLFSMFSIAVPRSADAAGYLALGGLPPVSYNQTFISTPILLTDLEEIGRTGEAYSYYTIRPDGYTLSGGLLDRIKLRMPSFIASSFEVIIDSGTSLNYLPYNLAAYVNGLFDPPATVSRYSGLYETDCNAKVPDFAIRINGTDFSMRSDDLLLTGDLGEDPYSGLCITGIQPSDELYILGDVFLRNVVAVFDVGANEMRFAARTD